MIDLLLNAWSLTALLMWALWLVQVKTKNASWVDIGWTFGLLICCWLYVRFTGPLNPRTLVLLIFVTLWAARLGSLLIARLIKDKKEDSRYVKIRADWHTHQNLKFFFFFQFQALLDVILSWGFLLICLNTSQEFSVLDYLGMAVWVVGFVGEILADQQLKRFKADAANKGKTCQVGLWNYSRHPNYFFEWLMWVAYFLMALPVAPYGWTACILPILMYYFLIHVSGVPLAEAQSLKSRGEEYRRYQQSTSMFIPWFKK